MKHVLTSFILLLACYAQSQVPYFKWAKNIIGDVIRHDGAGNVYITGSFSGSADFDPGPATYTLSSAGSTDIFLMKVDMDGNFIWAKQMGAAGGDEGMDLAIDASGNILLASYFSSTVNYNPGGTAISLSSSGSSDVAISKYDASGTALWAKKVGGPNTDIINGISTDASGNVYSTGYFMDLADFDPSAATYTLATSAGINDAFILKLDASGNFVWAKDLGGTANTLPKSIALDASGNIYTTGEFTGTADFNPGTAVSNLSSTTATFKDCYISRLDASGNFVWAKQVGGTDQDLGYCIRTDNSSNIYVSGIYIGTADFDPGTATYTMTTSATSNGFILKLDAGGNFVWAKQTQGSGNGITTAIQVDASANIYGVGRFSGTVDFDPAASTATMTSYGSSDAFVMKWNSTGAYVWAQQFGGTGSDLGVGMTVDANENIFLTGTYSGTADFDPGVGTYSLNILASDFMLRLSTCPVASLTLTGLNHVLCNGLSTGTATVSASGGSGFTYSWMPGGSTNASVTGLAAGIYTAVATNSCANTASVLVTITQPPALTNTNSGSQTICNTQSVSLHVTASGGVLPYTYAWTPPTGLSTTNASTVTASPAATTTYTFTVVDANGCGSGGSLNVTVNSLKDIAGTVTESSNPVAGQVTLYAYEPFLTKFDSITTQNTSGAGAYTFTSVPAGSYLVKATPSASTLQITYGSNSVSWKTATTITHSCVNASSQNIAVKTFTNIGTGAGSLSGKITEGLGFGQRPSLVSGPLAPGQPIKGVIVKGGKNPGGNMFAQTSTAADGTYTLSGLPSNVTGESYFILVDIPGLDTNTTYHKIITVTNPNFTNLDFVVDSAKVNPVPSGATGIGKPSASLIEANLYPNPAAGKTTVSYSISLKAPTAIRLYDISGRLVGTVLEETEQVPGSYHATVETMELESGLYFLKLRSGSYETTLRLMIRQ